jgi:hypothetical protein
VRADVGYRVITGGLRPDHATIARFRARHEQALGGLFSQVLRLLAAEGMVSLGLLSLDGTKLAGNAAQKANKTLPQIEKILAEAAAADAADAAGQDDNLQPATPRTLARRAERRERLAAARDRLPPRTRLAGPNSVPSRRPGTPRQLTGVRGLPGGRRTSRAPTATTPSRGRTSPTRTAG